MRYKKNVPKNKGFNLRQRSGFTLIELLVVISIVALIASVVIVAMNSARIDSRNAKRMADIRQIATGLELYFDRFEQYPFNGPIPIKGGYNEMDITLFDYDWDSSCGDDDSDGDFLTPLWNAEILLISPEDPLFTTEGNCYLYTAKTGVTMPEYIKGYYLAARLEDTDDAEQFCPGITLLNDYFCLSQKH